MLGFTEPRSSGPLALVYESRWLHCAVRPNPERSDHSHFAMQLGTSLLLVLYSVLHILALPLNGADFSSLSLLESQGITYKDDGAVKPFEQILSSHGFELARIRVWTAGTYTQNYALALAKRAKAAGMKILIDLHYSDTCMSFFYPQKGLTETASGADPGHQAIPSGWPTDLNGLNTQIYTYACALGKAESLELAECATQVHTQPCERIQ